MTLPERARAMADKLFDTIVINAEYGIDPIDCTSMPGAEAAILAALEETRREAIEEVMIHARELWHPGMIMKEFEKRIRALIDGPRQGGTEG